MIGYAIGTTAAAVLIYWASSDLPRNMGTIASVAWFLFCVGSGAAWAQLGHRIFDHHNDE